MNPIRYQVYPVENPLAVVCIFHDAGYAMELYTELYTLLQKKQICVYCIDFQEKNSHHILDISCTLSQLIQYSTEAISSLEALHIPKFLLCQGFGASIAMQIPHNWNGIFVLNKSDTNFSSALFKKLVTFQLFMQSPSKPSTKLEAVIENAWTIFSGEKYWISSDIEFVQAYMQYQHCSHRLSVRTWKLLLDAQYSPIAKQIRPDTIYIMGGTLDPITEYGTHVHSIRAKLINTMNSNTKMYTKLYRCGHNMIGNTNVTTDILYNIYESKRYIE